MYESYLDVVDGQEVWVKVIPEKEPDFTWEYCFEHDSVNGKTQFWTIYPDSDSK